jgi:hypothetical protein
MAKYMCKVEFYVSFMSYETHEKEVEIEADSEEEAKQLAAECDPPDGIDPNSEIDEVEVVSAESISEGDEIE